MAHIAVRSSGEQDAEGQVEDLVGDEGGEERGSADEGEGVGWLVFEQEHGQAPENHRGQDGIEQRSEVDEVVVHLGIQQVFGWVRRATRRSGS